MRLLLSALIALGTAACVPGGGAEPVVPVGTPTQVDEATPTATRTTAPTPDPAQAYVDQHGGSLEAYRRIRAMTDCTVLQGEFDQAAANHDAAEAGSPAALAATGFMTAADDRMRELGCY